MKLTKTQLYRQISYNDAKLYKAGSGICLYCYATTEFKKFGWYDNGKTAVCPECMVDTILPSTHYLANNRPELEKIHEKIFSVAKN